MHSLAVELKNKGHMRQESSFSAVEKKNLRTILDQNESIIFFVLAEGENGMF